MEFVGRIQKVLPMRSGVSQRSGNEWKAQPFVFEYFEHDTDRYSDKVLLETFNEGDMALIKEGATVRCGFGHSVREYEGRVYNEIRMYSIKAVGASAAPAENTKAAAAADAAGGDVEQKDDLPF